MGKQRKTWSTDVKEAIVLSVLRGELGVAEATRQHGANENGDCNRFQFAVTEV